MRKMGTEESARNAGKLRYYMSIQQNITSAQNTGCLGVPKWLSSQQSKPPRLDEALLIVGMTILVIYFILRPLFLSSSGM